VAAVSDPKTKDEAIAWAKRKLGSGTVVLEMSPEAAEDAFHDAIRWYVGRKGIKRYAVQNLVPGVQEYEGPEDCDEVLDLIFPGVQLDIIAAVNPYAFIDVDQLPVAYQSITGVPGGQFYGTLHQILQHAETARRVVGSEPAWEYDHATNIIRIAPRNQRSGTAVIRYASTVLVAEDPAEESEPKNDFRRLRFRDRDLILQMTLAEMKYRLVRSRAKYSDGMPSAGGNKMMDGESLLGEYQQDVERLTMELINLSDPVPFITG
jgi:hypothetical protein